MILPVLRLPLVRAFTPPNLTVEVKDANQDGFPDVEFHLTNRDPLAGFRIELTPWNFSQPAAPGTQSLFNATTDDNGTALIKTIPSGNYTINHGDTTLTATGSNTTMVGDVLTISPSQIKFNLTSDQEMLIEAIAISLMENRTDKGRALLEGLQSIFNYNVPLPSPDRYNATSGQCANYTCYLKARDYLIWLNGLKDLLDAERPSTPTNAWASFSVIVAAYRLAVTAHAMFYLNNLQADEEKLATNELDSDTAFALADKTLHERQMFSANLKAMGVLLIVLAAADLVNLILTGQITGDLIGNPLAHVKTILSLAKDVSFVVKAIANFAVSAGRISTMGSFFKFAGAVAGVVAIAFTVVQVLDLVNRFKCATIKCSWDLFVSDAFSGDIELYIQLFQIASGILVALGLLGPIAGIISAATAATVTGFGAVFALVALGLAAIYIWWSLGEIQKQLDIMRSGLSGQLSNFVRIRDSLYKMDPDLLRDQGTTSTSYATAAGQVAQVSTGRFKQDFLWLRYYFSRLSFAQQNLAVNVQEARVATDNLLKAFLYNSTGNKVFAGYLEGYNSTKAEFTGSQGLPRFTYNATIYGRQTYGSLGFKRHIISWSGSPSDAQRALNGTFAIEPSLDKVIKWGFQPKNESDGTVPFLPIYANATTTGSQQPLPSCGLQQFCFLGQSGSTTFNNDVYGSNSHLVLDKLNRTQSYFVYKYFINDTASTRQCLVQLPFDGCLCVCGGPYDGMQAWIDNFNSKIPIAQAALQKVNDSFEEYQISSNLKRGQVSSLLPISDPGLNRTVEGNTPDGGDVTLDGSRSFDPNDRPLTNYTWTGDFGKATTVSPTIHLTLGTHRIQLIVGNGMNYSLPAPFSVTVAHTIHPSVHITNPKEGMALQDGITFTITTQDLVPIKSVTLSVRDVNGSSIRYEGLPATLDSSGKNWIVSFNTRLLLDDHYTAVATATDETGLTMTNVVPYAIRNWAQVELLPASQKNQAGRTMPLKFSMRINATVDPSQPFVYNQQLTIRVYATSTLTLLQESSFGTSARDYRIGDGGKLYITNFRTSRQAMQYTVIVLRGTLAIGSFSFTTA